MEPPSLQPPNQCDTATASPDAITTKSVDAGTGIGDVTTANGGDGQDPGKTTTNASEDVRNGTSIQEKAAVVSNKCDTTSPSKATAATVQANGADGQDPGKTMTNTSEDVMNGTSIQEKAAVVPNNCDTTSPSMTTATVNGSSAFSTLPRTPAMANGADGQESGKTTTTALEDARNGTSIQEKAAVVPNNCDTTSPSKTTATVNGSSAISTLPQTPAMANRADGQDPGKTTTNASEDARNGTSIQEKAAIVSTNCDTTSPCKTTTTVNVSSAFSTLPGTSAMSGKQVANRPPQLEQVREGQTVEPAKDNDNDKKPAAFVATDTEIQGTPAEEATTSTTDFKFSDAFARILGIGAPGAGAVTDDEELQAIASTLLREDEDDKSSSDSSGKESLSKTKAKPRGKYKKNEKKLAAAKGTKKRSGSKTEPERRKRQRKKVLAFDPDDYLDDEQFSEIIIGDSGDGADAVVESPKKKRYSSPAAAPKNVDPSSDEDEVEEDDVMMEEGVVNESESVATPAPVIELGEFIMKSRADVQSAASLVSRSLATGCWPSPYRSLDPQKIYSRQLADYVSHNEHMSMVGVAIETFSNDIIAQAIIEELHHSPKEKRSESRAYLATLLNLREVLILNAATIFGPSALLTGNEADFLGRTKSDDPDMDEQVGPKLTATMLATAVIIDGLSTLGVDTGKTALAEELTIAFLDMAEKYEYVSRGQQNIGPGLLYLPFG
jgi:hypothetical protein